MLPRSPMLAALALAACGGEPTLGPLRLVRADPAPVAADRPVARLELPASLDEWSTEADAAELVEHEDLRALHLTGGRAQQVAIPARLVPGDFDLAAVEVVAGAALTLRVGLARRAPDGGRELVTGSLDVRFTPGGERRRQLFDLRRIATEERPFDELVVLASTAHDRELDWSLLGVELLDRPSEGWLPAPDAPELVAHDGDARRAVGLGPTPLLAHVRVPPGGRLHLSCAPAPRAPRAARVRISALSDDRRTFLGEVAVAAEGGWRDVHLPLDELEGRAVELEFGLAPPVDGQALVALGVPSLVVPDERPPTVLLVTSDTHRADHLGASGSDVGVLTPTLDALAAEGVLYTDCLAGSNVTLPSHAALMTGTDPATTGVVDNETRLSGDAATLAERFRAAGWATFAVVSAKHLNDGWSGLGQGFERMAWPTPERERAVAESVAQARAWLAEAEGRPLFLWLHVFDAHRPYDPPEEYGRAYYPRRKDPFARRLPEPGGPPPPHLAGLRDLEWARALYKGEVSHLDRQLAALLAEPRLAQAVVAFTADHGESLGEQGIWWDHVGVYPAVLRVPLVLRWPGAPRGTRVERDVRLADVSHTLLALAGLDARDFPGEDLARAARAAPRSPILRFALGGRGHALAVTRGRWHLVVNLHRDGVSLPLATVDHPRERPVELFDLGADPRCEQDLSRVVPELTADLARALLAWASAAEGRLAVRQVAEGETAALLAELGYAGSGERPRGGELVDLELLRERLAPFLQ